MVEQLEARKQQHVRVLGCWLYLKSSQVEQCRELGWILLCYRRVLHRHCLSLVGRVYTWSVRRLRKLQSI